MNERPGLLSLDIETHQEMRREALRRRTGDRFRSSEHHFYRIVPALVAGTLDPGVVSNLALVIDGELHFGDKLSIVNVLRPFPMSAQGMLNQRLVNGIR